MIYEVKEEEGVRESLVNPQAFISSRQVVCAVAAAEGLRHPHVLIAITTNP